MQWINICHCRKVELISSYTTKSDSSSDEDSQVLRWEKLKKNYKTNSMMLNNIT